MPATGEVCYVATGAGAGSDPAWARRVAEHRARRPSGWTTVETADLADRLRACPDTPTLVDDLGGWLASTLDRRGWNGPVGDDLDELVAAISAFRAPLVLVSPEVGLMVVPATESGRRFADELGTLNRRLAGCCEQVVLVVAGLPVWVKPTTTEAFRL